MHCQIMRCTPCPLGLRRFRTAKGSDVRPGVPSSLRALLLLRSRRGIMSTVKSLIYALASIGTPFLLRGRRGIM